MCRHQLSSLIMVLSSSISIVKYHGYTLHARHVFTMHNMSRKSMEECRIMTILSSINGDRQHGNQLLYYKETIYFENNFFSKTENLRETYLQWRNQLLLRLPTSRKTKYQFHDSIVFRMKFRLNWNATWMVISALVISVNHLFDTVRIGQTALGMVKDKLTIKTAGKIT